MFRLHPEGESEYEMSSTCNHARQGYMWLEVRGQLELTLLPVFSVACSSSLVTIEHCSVGGFPGNNPPNIQAFLFVFHFPSLSPVSMAVHRVGKTLLIDEFNAPVFFSRQRVRGGREGARGIRGETFTQHLHIVCRYTICLFLLFWMSRSTALTFVGETVAGGDKTRGTQHIAMYYLNIAM